MANTTFKIGDVVKRTEANAYANGTKRFRHGKETAVIERIVEGAFGNTIVWFEHGTNIGIEDIELVTPAYVPTAVKPAPLDLKGFLTALNDADAVVSVDPDDESVTDTYHSFEGFADDVCSFEIADNDFYLEEDWDTYQNALKADKEAEAKAKDLTFEEAVKLLAVGTAVTSFDDDGDEVDTYTTIEDLKNLAGFEIDGVWRKVE